MKRETANDFIRSIGCNPDHVVSLKITHKGMKVKRIFQENGAYVIAEGRSPALVEYLIRFEED